MAAPDRIAQAEAAIAALLDDGVAVAVTDPRQPQPDAVGREADHLARAVGKRRAEFLAGRAMARQAMAALGMPAQEIPARPDRLPLWPEGVTGTISHSDTLCAAAVTRAPVLLGLDLEPATALDMSLLDTVCSPAEQARLAGADLLRHAKLVFSAKEAAFKAQYPASRRIFEFDHFDVTLDPAACLFHAVFTADVPPFTQGSALAGRFAEIADHFVTTVTLPNGA